MKLADLKRQIGRLVNEQRKVQRVTKDHQQIVQDRYDRLQRLAQEFKQCRSSLTALDPTPEHLVTLWSQHEDFKEELLELAELLSEYFRRSNQRIQKADASITRLEQLTHAKKEDVVHHRPSSTTSHLVSNPFLM